MITDKLQQAIQLIKAGDHRPARDLLLEVVKENPQNLTAWLWALEVAVNEKEKRLILHKILEIDPNHRAALGYLRKLDQQGDTRDQSSEIPSGGKEQLEESAVKRSGFSGLLGLIFDWASSLPSGCFFIAIFFTIVIGVFIYTQVNTSLFGLAGTDFDDLNISNSYQQISSEDYSWDIQFEGIGSSKFKGTVRHIAPIRIQEYSILTHDILVTSGDYADPDIVTTNVIDHKFFWRSPNTSSPSGSINLIHALPANKSIYQELLEIQKWETVIITGREIFTVKAYQPDGTFIGTWQDAGCNTLLVESVTFIDSSVNE
jgi:hypothetical protein